MQRSFEEYQKVHERKRFRKAHHLSPVYEGALPMSTENKTHDFHMALTPSAHSKLARIAAKNGLSQASFLRFGFERLMDVLETETTTQTHVPMDLDPFWQSFKGNK